MEDFLHRTLTLKSEKFQQMKVMRTRTSAGLGSIKVEFSGQSIEISNANGNNTYEEQARHLANLLSAICENPCKLPE